MGYERAEKKENPVFPFHKSGPASSGLIWALGTEKSVIFKYVKWSIR
jgi:hypothetical protein